MIVKGDDYWVELDLNKAVYYYSVATNVATYKNDSKNERTIANGD